MRLEKASGLSAAARDGEMGTKMKGGGGAEIKYWEIPKNNHGLRNRDKKSSPMTAKVTPPWPFSRRGRGAKGNPGNYRPVSLTSIPCKVMESCMRDVMVDHLAIVI